VAPGPLSGTVVSANVRMRLMKTAAARSAFVNWSDCEARLIAPEGERARELSESRSLPGHVVAKATGRKRRERK